MFWTKKVNKDENYKKVLEILELLRVQYVGLEKEVEFLQIKFKKIAGISKKKDEIEEEISEKHTDPFDNIRKSRRSLEKVDRIGL